MEHVAKLINVLGAELCKIWEEVKYIYSFPLCRIQVVKEQMAKMPELVEAYRKNRREGVFKQAKK